MLKILTLSIVALISSFACAAESKMPTNKIDVNEYYDFLINKSDSNPNLLTKSINPSRDVIIYYFTFKADYINSVEKYFDGFTHYVIAVERGTNKVKGVQVHLVQLNCRKLDTASKFRQDYDANGNLEDKVTIEYQIIDSVSRTESEYCKAQYKS